MTYKTTATSFESSVIHGMFNVETPYEKAAAATKAIMRSINVAPKDDMITESEARSVTGSKRAEVAKILRDNGVKMSPEEVIIRARDYDAQIPGGSGVRWTSKLAAEKTRTTVGGIILVGATIINHLSGNRIFKDMWK